MVGEVRMVVMRIRRSPEEPQEKRMSLWRGRRRQRVRRVASANGAMDDGVVSRKEKPWWADWGVGASALLVLDDVMVCGDDN